MLILWISFAVLVCIALAVDGWLLHKEHYI